ncbi:MAG: hypothetical protein OEW60_02510 [Thiovulaceae bacterium]|nr:hypothetical protein [Sulfurimonadaceae bacterium]
MRLDIIIALGLVVLAGITLWSIFTANHLAVS